MALKSVLFRVHEHKDLCEIHLRENYFWLLKDYCHLTGQTFSEVVEQMIEICINQKHPQL